MVRYLVYPKHLILYHGKILHLSWLMKDVFLRLASQRRVPENPKAWLFRSVRNAAISQLRRQKRRRMREKNMAADRSEWFESRVDDLLDAKAAQDALASLPTEQREVVVLRLWAGMTLRETAGVVDRHVSTVFREYREAVAAVRRRLGVSCEAKKN